MCRTGAFSENWSQIKEEMAFRGKEMMKIVLKRVGENNLNPRVKQSLEKCIPRSKVVMGRAKRGLFAGRHIQFGNSVSEDGGQGERGNLMSKKSGSSVTSWIVTFGSK
ncbi:hypothetical protein Ahy_B04g071900 isoform C [Arachis hypogaea]|uniref:Uncharacterized protein n=1 Tax=Arachis hypogaea TaxID=3818 RepID=A0A444ZLY8_ARAHY|nr:hypothetical protein Ahy_B04g071900 isoform C [Arachis hypogaea]